MVEIYTQLCRGSFNGTYLIFFTFEFDNHILDGWMLVQFFIPRLFDCFHGGAIQ